MKITILGCGGSGGVPLIGPHWGDCNPDNPKNRRRRVSIARAFSYQANLRILQSVARNLDLPWERVMCNVEEVGNIGSASIPVALREAEQTGRIASGATVLLASFGAGFHWAAMLLRWP